MSHYVTFFDLLGKVILAEELGSQKHSHRIPRMLKPQAQQKNLRKRSKIKVFLILVYGTHIIMSAHQLRIYRS